MRSATTLVLRYDAQDVMMIFGGLRPASVCVYAVSRFRIG